MEIKHLLMIFFRLYLIYTTKYYNIKQNRSNLIQNSIELHLNDFYFITMHFTNVLKYITIIRKLYPKDYSKHL